MHVMMTRCVCKALYGAFGAETVEEDDDDDDIFAACFAGHGRLP